jgi:hypothetical protein
MLGLMLLSLLLQGQGPRDVQLEAGPKPPVVVPKGTVIPVELLNRLSTNNLKEGDNIYARTIFPITVDNKIVIPVGTNVQGKIKEVEKPGHLKRKASLTLSFQTMILPSGLTLPIYGSLGSSDEGTREGEAKIKNDSNAGKDTGAIVKGGAAGAVVGTIFRGKRGAAIGGAAGASAALAGVLATRGEDLTLPKGTEIEVVLDQELEL